MVYNNDLEANLTEINIQILEKKNYKCKKYLIDLINILIPITCFMSIFITLIIICLKIYKI